MKFHFRLCTNTTLSFDFRSMVPVEHCCLKEMGSETGILFQITNYQLKHSDSFSVLNSHECDHGIKDWHQRLAEEEFGISYKFWMQINYAMPLR